MKLWLLICATLLIVSFSFTARADTSNPREQWFDSYGRTSWEQERIRLDNFAVFLIENRKMKGYIALYSLPNETRSDINNRIIRIRQYITQMRGVDVRRLRIIIAGTNESGLTILQPVERGVPRPKFP